jgi:hypothetical protein
MSSVFGVLSSVSKMSLYASSSAVTDLSTSGVVVSEDCCPVTILNGSDMVHREEHRTPTEWASSFSDDGSLSVHPSFLERDSSVRSGSPARGSRSGSLGVHPTGSSSERDPSIRLGSPARGSRSGSSGRGSRSGSPARISRSGSAARGSRSGSSGRRSVERSRDSGEPDSSDEDDPIVIPSVSEETAESMMYMRFPPRDMETAESVSMYPSVPYTQNLPKTRMIGSVSPSSFKMSFLPAEYSVSGTISSIERSEMPVTPGGWVQEFDTVREQRSTVRHDHAVKSRTLPSAFGRPPSKSFPIFTCEQIAKFLRCARSGDERCVMAMAGSCMGQILDHKKPLIPISDGGMCVLCERAIATRVYGMSRLDRLRWARDGNVSLTTHGVVVGVAGGYDSRFTLGADINREFPLQPPQRYFSGSDYIAERDPVDGCPIYIEKCGFFGRTEARRRES